MRNIKANLPALRSRCCIGDVVRHDSVTFVRHLEGRRPNVPAANMRVYGGHHVGRSCHCHGVRPPLPSHVRVACVDVCKVRWCSVGNVPFHSFVWPTFDLSKAKYIARTIWINHCGWANICVIRGRRWCSHRSYFKSNRVLENLLWHWCDTGRPSVVYKEGDEEIGGGDPVPAWLNCNVYCVRDSFCQCNWVGVDASGGHSTINGQVRSKFQRMFSCNCLYSGIKTHYPSLNCHKHTMDAHVAAKLARSVVLMFADLPRDDTRLVPIKLRRVDVREMAHLSKEDIFRMIESIDRIESASSRVCQFLSKCRARRSKQRPPPKRVLWENRPRSNGSITNLT